MKLSHLEILDENELHILFYIVNHLFPSTIPKMEYDMNSIKWIKHDQLAIKLINSFPKIKLENHVIYSSLLKKLGINHEIKYENPIVDTNNTGSI